LVTDVDVFLAARTVLILWASNADLLSAKGFLPRWKVYVVRGLIFPSDALLGEVDLSLDVSLGCGCCFGVAPVRRREEAEGDRDSGVKVQIDDLSVRENLFSNAFRRNERKTRRGLLLLWVKEGEEESVWITSLNSCLSFN
jgi:hypothetical protein